MNRYNGRTPEPWSVASHPVLVSMLCRADLRALGLHDAHEMIVGDLTVPAVHLICASEQIDGFVIDATGTTKRNLDRQIFGAWGVSWTPADLMRSSGSIGDARQDRPGARALACGRTDAP